MRLARVLTAGGALVFAAFARVGHAQAPVGIFDGQADVGRVLRAGSTSYDAQRQTYLVAGSGQNMWNDRDDFRFVWKRMSGNFILSTRARFIGKGVEAHRKIGWTIRPSLEPNSPHVSAALHGDGLVSLQFRRAIGGTSEEKNSPDSLPNADAVIQLERRDGVYVMSVAQFGETLVTQDLTGVSLPDTVYVGLFVCAHNDTVVERATFSNVRITTPPKKDYVAYRDYIGSNLEILDVATGNATIVHQYSGSFQAPNWTRDGKALIYAQEGRLYRFDLASRSAAPINTGFATRNNNDHVLSFDGRMMAISHHAVEDSGNSIIYTVPARGGTPKRVTAKGPSYLHGWSPDGRWLVYTGIRGDELDVYKIPVTGGDEIRLTTAPGLDDGPEFTPDGQWIYFNSSRSGRMQIWRMRPDGREQQQITNDGFNNWFPHISPDGKWIAYLAFPPPPEVAADDHPFYKHVLLRLMPIGGGGAPARVIAYVYGGQGTINVPSWSPDGKRLAFVSNSAVPARNVSTQRSAPADVVFVRGRVLDPETNLDAVRAVHVRGGRIVSVTTRVPVARDTVDVSGLVVAPGFIDLHAHGQDSIAYRFFARDGVTTALELEIGSYPIGPWYAEREGKALINFGASASHIGARRAMLDGDSTVEGAAVIGATGAFVRAPIDRSRLPELERRLDAALNDGALGIGMGINYTPAATREEVIRVFAVAARHRSPVFVHLRSAGLIDSAGGVLGLQEVIADAAVTGAPLHVVHVTSMGLAATPSLLELIEGARKRGLDVTTEAYPYTAGATMLQSAIFDAGFKERMGIDYKDILWPATGERLTAESFERYRKQGGLAIIFSIPESAANQAYRVPHVIVASDGGIQLQNGVLLGHPRGAGTHARILGRFVRERRVLSLMDGVRKMTLLAARRLETVAPDMKRKGRIQPGADADIVVFDPARVIDRATFEQPAQYSDGIVHVMVNGTFVVRESNLVTGVAPGRAVRGR